MEGERWADGRVRAGGAEWTNASIIKNTSSIYRGLLRGNLVILVVGRNGIGGFVDKDAKEKIL
jgi:hypothetical protein